MNNINTSPVVEALSYWQDKFPPAQKEAIIKLQKDWNHGAKQEEFEILLNEVVNDFGNKETEELLEYVYLYRSYMVVSVIEDIKTAGKHTPEQLEKMKADLGGEQNAEKVAIDIFYGWLDLIDHETKSCLKKILSNSVVNEFSDETISQCKQEIKKLPYPQQEEVITFIETFMKFAKECKAKEGHVKEDPSKKIIEQIKQDLLKLTPKERWEYIKDINTAIYSTFDLDVIFNKDKDCVGFKFKNEGINDNEQ